MKKSIFSITATMLLLGLAVMARGQQFGSPVLITSAGQSADVNLVKMLAVRHHLEASTILMATPDDLAGVKTLVVVPGFSSKGLGAAGISQEEEMSRIRELVALAGQKRIPIIMMHIGGNARRLGQSDAFNELIARNSVYMIVVSQGDEDGFFSRIASDKNIPLIKVEKIAETGEPLAKLFN